MAEESLKQDVISALHHEEIKHHPRTIRLGKPYENQYNWEGLQFPVSIKKIDKFVKNNPAMAVNVLYSNKKSQKKNKCTVRRLGRRVKWKKQLNLLMIKDGELRPYRISRIYPGSYQS